MALLSRDTGMRGGSLRRLALGALAGAGAGTLLLVALAATLAGMRPAWWAPPDPRSAEVAARARTLENDVVNRAYAHAAGEPWTLDLDERAASAWLTARLPAWLASRGQRSDAPPIQVLFDAGGVTLGARTPGVDAGRVVSLRLRPWVDEAGRLRPGVVGAGVGRLNVPGPLVGASARRVASRVGDPGPGWLDGSSARVALGDGRVVRIVGVEVREGVLRLRLLTERE